MRVAHPFALLSLTLAGAAGAWAQTPLYSFSGERALDYLGSSVAGLGDVDGDGCADFAVGMVQSSLVGGAGLVRVYSGRAARVLFEVSGEKAGDGFGVAVAGCGDVDRDGVPDLVIGATPTEATTLPGYVRVCSGKDGRQLHALRGDAPGSWFGVSVGGCGDLDGDGHADFVVGAPLQDGLIPRAGVVRAYSGRTGSVLFRFEGSAREEYFGFATAGAGDVDRDGVPDIVVGVYRSDVPATDAGSALVYSGKTGNVVRTFYGNNVGDGFGFSVAAAGDVDRDGYDDLIVGALWDDPLATDAGSAWVFSGKTALPIHRLDGDAAFDGMGTSVAGAGDVDGDGWPDLAAGAIQAFPPGRSGYLKVWSGRDGRPLHTLGGLAVGAWFGFSVANAGDVNGDGTPDLLAGAPHSSEGLPLAGGARVFAGNHVALQASPPTLSLASGGVQILKLDARQVHAGRLYWVLGTAGATVPGIPLPRVRVPLTIDDYFWITVVSPNTPLLTLTLGTLGPAGTATAFFRLPAGLSSGFAGLTLHHTFVVLDNDGVAFASNPASLRLVQ